MSAGAQEQLEKKDKIIQKLAENNKEKDAFLGVEHFNLYYSSLSFLRMFFVCVVVPNFPVEDDSMLYDLFVNSLNCFELIY